MKLLILESFSYELHVFYWYFMFHLKLNLYMSAFPTVVMTQIMTSLKGLILVNFSEPYLNRGLPGV